VSFDYVDIDGNSVTVLSPSRFVRQLPRYQDWKRFLSTRPEHAHLVDGRVLFTCICCGQRYTKLEMSEIRIGGLIRQSVETVVGHREIEISAKPLPVSKLGLGCPTCFTRYDAVIRATNTENKEREEINRIQDRLSTLTGETFRAKSRLTPFIDVLSEGGQE
jgi:hypothetical protein